MNSFC